LPQQLQAFVDGEIWLSQEELGQQADPDPLLTLLTLPVRVDAELPVSTDQLLHTRAAQILLDWGPRARIEARCLAAQFRLIPADTSRNRLPLSEALAVLMEELRPPNTQA
jgi:hypothetical protein